jgi:hypothetical protein
MECLRALVDKYFEVLTILDGDAPHSEGRICRTSFLAQKKVRVTQPLDRETVLRAYEAEFARG